MLYGYMRRGSGADARQLAALCNAGVKEHRLYEDQDRGREGLEACLEAIGPGDTLLVWQLGRLGRDLRDRIHIADRLAARGAQLRVLSGRAAADGPLMSELLAALAEFERDFYAEVPPPENDGRAQAQAL